jgi:hypothetical protein
MTDARRSVALAILGLDVLIAIFGTMAPGFVAGAPESLLPPRSLAFPALFLAAGVTGVAILRRHPAHLVGWILALSSLVGALVHAMAGYTAVALYGGVLPGALYSAWIFSWLDVLHLAPLATLVLLLFPDGRLPSRRWAPVAWLAIADTVGLAVAVMFLPVPVPIFGTPNPFGIAPAAPILFAAAGAGFALEGILAIACAVSLVRRYRRASLDDQQRIKWVAYAGILVLPATIAILGLGLPLEATALLATLAYIPIPIAMAIAIVRYRLYDVDRLIDGTLVYGSVSLVLLGTYVLVVIALQGALAPFTAGSDIAVAGSTLIVVALFQPVRRRAQDMVDRRFYRSRYDAARIVDGFTARLRDVVDIDAVRDDLLEVVAATVQPGHAGLWLRSRDRNDFRTPAA